MREACTDTMAAEGRLGPGTEGCRRLRTVETVVNHLKNKYGLTTSYEPVYNMGWRDKGVKNVSCTGRSEGNEEKLPSQTVKTTWESV